MVDWNFMFKLGYGGTGTGTGTGTGIPGFFRYLVPIFQVPLPTPVRELPVFFTAGNGTKMHS
jgi:hypothetical protein